MRAFSGRGVAGRAHLTDPLGERERVEHVEVVHFERQAGEQEDEVGDREVREVRVGGRAHVPVREQHGQRDRVAEHSGHEDDRVDGRERHELRQRQTARQERFGVERLDERTRRRRVRAVLVVGARVRRGGQQVRDARRRVGGRSDGSDEAVGGRPHSCAELCAGRETRDQRDRNGRLESGQHDDYRGQLRVRARSCKAALGIYKAALCSTAQDFLMD